MHPLKFVSYWNYSLPLYSCPVSAGFPSPADDHLDGHINLNDHLIPHPSATFLVRASGMSMLNEGIRDRDILIVDRSVIPSHGRVVVAAINGELTVKKLFLIGERKFLEAANPDYDDIEITEHDDVFIWGVVLYSIHKV